MSRTWQVGRWNNFESMSCCLYYLFQKLLSLIFEQMWWFAFRWIVGIIEILLEIIKEQKQKKKKKIQS